MSNLFLIVGTIIIVIGLILLRVGYSPVLRPDTKLFVDLLNECCSKKRADTNDDLSSNIKGTNKT